MIAARRLGWNFALDRAVAWAKELGKPLVILEALRAGHRWASDRLHRFVLDGMQDNLQRAEAAGVLYLPYLEMSDGEGRGLLAALAARASVVVTDEFPGFFLPRMVKAAAEQIDVLLEVVDGNGLLPLAAIPKDFTAAAHFRRFVQRELPKHLSSVPRANPFARWSPPRARIPREIAARWKRAPERLLAGAIGLEDLPIDHDVPPVAMRGGSTAASAALRRFLRRIDAYAELRNHPSADATSRLSPYLHFGHVSAHEIVHAVMKRGMSEGAEAFLDQLVVWRELGYNTAAKLRGYDRFESLPKWAKATLEKHRSDPRPHLYTRAELEEARTHDPLWNAAQRQLRQEGWFHNYLRMLWGKKILEWSKSPKAALATMIELMNRWSLDGRNPNSYSGFFWTLGRYDRPWPERPIYGTVRSMSSERTAKKVDVARYLERFGHRPHSRG